MLPLEQLLKGVAESGVLFRLPFGGSFCPATGHTMLFGFVPLKQKRLNIIFCVLPAVLVEHTGAFGKTHGSKPIILCDDDVTGTDTVYKSKIHTVSALVKHQCLRTVTVDFVGGVTKKDAFHMLLSAYRNGNVCHRTGIRIN